MNEHENISNFRYITAQSNIHLNSHKAIKKQTLKSQKIRDELRMHKVMCSIKYLIEMLLCTFFF